MVGSREAGTVDLNQGATAFAASSRARCLNLWANWCTLVGTSLRATGLPLLGLGLEEGPGCSGARTTTALLGMIKITAPPRVAL